MKLSEINPFQSRWKVKVKVLIKRSIYFWQNEKGSGKLFSMDIADEKAQIRVTAFNDEVDKFFDKIERY